MNIMPWIWIGLTVVFILIEVATSGLTTIWFAAGSFLMIFASFINFPLWVQISLFVTISLLLLIFTRPILKQKLAVKKTATNSDAIIGKKAVVTQAISEMKKGAIKINGLEWTASSADNQQINEGDTCVVTRIVGATAIVKKINSTNQ